MTRPVIDIPPSPEHRAALDTAARLLREVLDGTEWCRTWIGSAPDLLVGATHLTLKMNNVRDCGRGDERIGADAAAYRNLEPFPTTLLEAAELLRRVLSHFFDHELREFMRGAGRAATVRPHGLGDAVPGANTCSSALD